MSEVTNGLTNEQVTESRRIHGSNQINTGENRVFFQVLKEVVLEPMFLLLMAACIVYLAVGEYREGIIMLVSVFLVAGISLFQEYRSRNAVQALKKLSAAKATVRRNGQTLYLPAEEVVVNDILLVEEGEIVPADATVLSANDFSVSESILTGESFSVYKNTTENNNVYKGTLVTSGSATVQVAAVGSATLLGKIGASLQAITVVKTPLQQQVRSFVRSMVAVGIVAFLAVVGVNYYQTHDITGSFLQGLTLAMSILPEEIPVAFSTFQALGAFRLLRSQVIVKQPQYVETLGSATVICTDKTGTLTQNKMQVHWVYDGIKNISIQVEPGTALPEMLITYAMWSSETHPFDPMEKALHELYEQAIQADERHLYEQVHEYPIGGKPPMMTHIFSHTATGQQLIAAKGAPEAILQLSNLPEPDRRRVEAQVAEYARQGYRVLGVGKGEWQEKHWPVSQEEFSFVFLGLIAFHDPPKENIATTIRTFNEAGIQVKIITGDYAETALAIARQIGLNHNTEVLTGKDVLHLNAEALQEKVKQVNIFARMFPEAKLKVITALKEAGEVVAMTGDGVNDGPALKAAHIGIAMGQRGSEVAKNAASLILTDDDLAHMTEAVALGRKIYDNLKKAIRYIVSIHLPIILIVALPLLLSWTFTDIFSPVHVIFLELIMGPTCSIIYENEPMEPGTMRRAPARQAQRFLSFKQLSISLVQGLAITAACLGLGYHYLQQGSAESLVRTVIFITLLFSNIFLTLVNRSFRHSLFTTLRYRNNLVPLVIGITLLFIACILWIPAAQQLFRLQPLNWPVLFSCMGAAAAGTLWMELWKAIKRNGNRVSWKQSGYA